MDAGQAAGDERAQEGQPARTILNVHALIAVGVNADGHRETLGLD